MGLSRRHSLGFWGGLILLLLNCQVVLGDGLVPADMDTMLVDSSQFDSSLPDDPSTYTSTDSSYFEQNVTVKPVEQKNWKKAKDGLDYTPGKKKVKAKKEETEHQRSIPIFGEWMKYILFAMVLLGLGYLIYRIVVSNLLVSNKSIERSDIELLGDIEDNLQESDLEKALRLALANKDYRLAIRIYYLSVIKELNTKQWITWKRDKTNYEYIREMGARKLTPLFMQLTLVFERAWYGDKEVTEEDYNSVSVTFTQFIAQLKNAPEHE